MSEFPIPSRVWAKSSSHSLGILGKKFSLKKRKNDVFNSVFDFCGKGLKNADDKSRGGPFPLSKPHFASFQNEMTGSPWQFRWTLAFCANANNPSNLPFQFWGHMAKSTSRWYVRFFKYLHSCSREKGGRKFSFGSHDLTCYLSIKGLGDFLGCLPIFLALSHLSLVCVPPGASVKPQETLLLSIGELKAFKKQWKTGSVLIVLGFGLWSFDMLLNWNL